MSILLLNVNSLYRTTGTIDDYSIVFPWPTTYSPASIKVLQVIPPDGYTNLVSKVLYVTSNVISGMDLGYVPINNNTLQTTVYDSGDSVIAVIKSDETYRNTDHDPFMTCTGTTFGTRYTLPQPNRTIKLKLKNIDGTSPGSTNNWNIVLASINDVTEI